MGLEEEGNISDDSVSTLFIDKPFKLKPKQQVKQISETSSSADRGELFDDMNTNIVSSKFI